MFLRGHCLSWHNIGSTLAWMWTVYCLLFERPGMMWEGHLPFKIWCCRVNAIIDFSIWYLCESNPTEQVTTLQSYIWPTTFIGQQHPITVYRTGFWVCVVLVLSFIGVPLANPLMKLYFIMIIILLCIISYETKFSYSFLFGLICIFQLPSSGICKL